MAMRSPPTASWQRIEGGWPLFYAAGTAAQVGLDLQPRAAAEAGAVNLKVLHDPLHVVARLGERDQLDPVDRVDLRVARIAVAINPLFHAAAAGVVGGKRHDVGAAIILEQAAKLGRAECGVVD